MGTFNPVEVEDLSKHKMDSEELIIDQDAVDLVNAAKSNKKRICAVGTTVMRGLESSGFLYENVKYLQGLDAQVYLPTL